MGLPDINVRVLGNKATLSPLFESYSMSANSDYAPVVDLYAVKSRFFDLTASPQFHSIEFDRLPIADARKETCGYQCLTCGVLNLSKINKGSFFKHDLSVFYG